MEYKALSLVEIAMHLAIELHGEQSRKASIVPNAAYMSHLMEVAGMVWGCFAVDDSTTETVVAAALLHDAIEDQPMQMPQSHIERLCGREVLNLVEELTEKGTGGTQKAPWKQRKQDYLDHISEMSTSALLISVCDKLQSARELKRQGYSAYVPFKKDGELARQCQERQVLFHQMIAIAFQDRLCVIAKDFKGPIIAAIQAFIDEFREIMEDLV